MDRLDVVAGGDVQLTEGKRLVVVDKGHTTRDNGFGFGLWYVRYVFYSLEFSTF